MTAVAAAAGAGDGGGRRSPLEPGSQAWLEKAIGIGPAKQIADEDARRPHFERTTIGPPSHLAASAWTGTPGVN